MINWLGEHITNMLIGKENRHTSKWSDFDFYFRSALFLFGGIGILIAIAIPLNLMFEFVIFYICINAIRFFSGGYHSYDVLEFCWIVTAFLFTISGLLCQLTENYFYLVFFLCVLLSWFTLQRTPYMRPEDIKHTDLWYKSCCALILLFLLVVGFIFKINAINWSIIMVWATITEPVNKLFNNIGDKLFKERV